MTDPAGRESDPGARRPAPPSAQGAEGTGFRQQVVAALKWNVSGEIAFQAIRFTFGIALARLLSPHELGLMAMVMVFVQFLMGNTDLGFEEALIQHRRVAEVHRSSVFWILLAASILLTLAQLATAPWIGEFYGVEELVPLTLALAAVYVLRALGTVPSAILTRQLDFRTISAWRCVAGVVAGTCAVTLAWMGFGVLSLAVQFLLSTGLESVLLLAACGWRPRFELRLAALRELLGFSAYRPAARILNYWGQRVDQLLVGRLLGASALGMYSQAFRLARLPVAGVSRGLVDVMFPSLALIQEDRARVGAAYLRTTGAVALWSVPVALGLFIAAPAFVVGVLGPQWWETAPVLRLLSLAALFQSLTVFANSLCLAQGRADLVLRLTIVQRLTTLAAVVAGLRWGVHGVATAQLLSAACHVLPTLYFAGRLVDVSLRAVLVQLSRVFLAGVGMAIVVHSIDAWATGRFVPLQVLAVDVVAGAFAYPVALCLLRVPISRDLRAVLVRPSRSRRTPGSRH